MFRFAIGVLLLFRLCRAQSLPNLGSAEVDKITWTHHAVLDNEGKVQLFWLPGLDDIIFEAQFETKGWIGIGFSPDGTMHHADIVVGWVINKEPTLQDRYSIGHTVPEMDAQQDYKLLIGFENDTHTILRFQRKYNTCDQKDRVITNSTMRVIYAYHHEDPQQGELVKHQKAGSRSLYLAGFNNVLIDIGPNSQVFEMRMQNITLPLAEKSFCWNKVFKFAPTSSNDVVIGFQPIWKMDLAGAIDHIWLYQCNVKGSNSANWDQLANERGHKCYAHDAPSEYSNCTRVIASATVGSMGTRVPQKTGYSFGQETGDSVYFLLEVAYRDWKMQGTDELHDSSGFAMIYTSEAMPHQSGTLTVGHALGMSQIIPLDQMAFASMGYCNAECTKKSLPQDGIFVYEVFIQSKIYGREMRLRHLRNGTEMTPIAKDDSYDPRAQIYRVFLDPVHVLPGDNFILECTYDTKLAQHTVLGGYGADNEACLAYLNYFPRSDLQKCTSTPPLSKLFQWLGTKEAVDVEPATFQELAESVHNQKFVEYLNYYNWASRGSEFQTLMREEYTSVCTTNDKQNDTISGPHPPAKVNNPYYVHDPCGGLLMPGIGTMMENNNTMDNTDFAWPSDHDHDHEHDHGHDHGSHDHFGQESSQFGNHDTMMGDHPGHDMPHDGHFMENSTMQPGKGNASASTPDGASQLEGSLTTFVVTMLATVSFILNL